MIDLTSSFSQSSWLTQIFLAYAAGLIASLSPCIYPLIPITLSVIGANSSNSRGKSILLALTYVMGMAACYTAIGYVSVQSGLVLGTLSNSYYVILPLSLVLFVLTLYTYDLIPLSFIGSIQNSSSKVSGTGFKAAFFMGAVSGFVAAPCATPMLAVILALASANYLSILLLFFYALGLGTLFIVLASFSGARSILPKSGNWLSAVKAFMGFALFASIFYLIINFVPYKEKLLASDLSYTLFVILLIFSMYYATKAIYRTQKIVVCITGMLAAACLICGINYKAPQAYAENSAELKWISNYELALAEAKASNKPIFIDLYAEWCASCKELEEKTFSDANVKTQLKQFVVARIDFTDDSEESQLISAKYKVLGLPCLLFLDSQGNEISERITGFIAAPEFENKLSQINNRAKN